MAMEEHEIVELGEMAVLGVMGQVSCGADVGSLWEPAFVRRMDEIKSHAVVRGKYYGVSLDSDHYLAGMVVEPPTQIPEGPTLRRIPAGRYVRFVVDEKRWHEEGPFWVFDRWLPSSGFEWDSSMQLRSFEIYGQKGSVPFCVPIREKQ